MSEPIILNDDNIDDAIKEHSLLIVDCWADWCGPCKMMHPIIDKVSHDFVDITFAKLDVDKNPETTKKYKIRSIPYFLLFKDGEKVGEILGSMSEPKFVEKIFEHW